MKPRRRWGTQISMLTRLARAYSIFLFSAQIVLFVVCLVVHVYVFAVVDERAFNIAKFLWAACIILMLPAMAFIKDSPRWMQQLKACPVWMCRIALGVWAYGFVIFFLRLLFPVVSEPMSDPLVLSGIPLGFEAITICLLYAALWRGYLNESELNKSAGLSLAFAFFVIVIFGTYKAGFLPTHSITH